MLLSGETLAGIEAGSITLAFRRWTRPTVKAGGTLLTPIGQLAIEAVHRVEVDEIAETDAAAAGFTSRDALRAELAKRTDGDVYRVRLSLAGPDPRIALRQSTPEGAELEALLARLAVMDARRRSGPSSRQILETIRDRPGVLAAELAAELGEERAPFKSRVRKLKALGLTESLTVGYRLSPRGSAVLEALEA